MKPLMNLEDEHELSAHEILATHVTNVSDVTAKVIRSAVKEYDALLNLRMEPFIAQLEVTRSQIAELAELIKRYAEVPQNGSGR